MTIGATGAVRAKEVLGGHQNAALSRDNEQKYSEAGMDGYLTKRIISVMLQTALGSATSSRPSGARATAEVRYGRATMATDAASEALTAASGARA